MEDVKGLISNSEDYLSNYKFSDTELRILEVALDPSFAGKSMVAKCSAANVARNTWYRAMGNPKFVEALNKLSVDLLKGKVGDIINATYKYAMSSAKNSADRKILLTMVGAYTEKQETIVSGQMENKIDFSGMSTEQIKEILNQDE